MSTSDFNYNVEALQQRVSELQTRAAKSPTQLVEILPETFQELQTALEELRVVAEELQGKNEELVFIRQTVEDELAATRQTVEMERQRYQDLFNFAPDGYLVTDTTGTIQEANCTAAMLLGVSQSFLVGKPLVVFVAKGDRKIFRTLLTRLIQRQQVQNWEVCLQPRENPPFHTALTVATVLNPQGKPVALRWLIRDITERKRAEEKIRFQAHLLDVVEQAVIATDLDGRIIYWNRFAEKLYGWAATEAVGRSVVEVISAAAAEDQVAEILARLRTDVTWSGELLRKHRDSTTFPTMVTNWPIHDDQGRLVGTVSVSADVTVAKHLEAERQRAETEIRHALTQEKELGDLKSRFISMTSHEFRNPLTVVLTSAQLLENFKHKLSDEKKLELLHRIQAAGKIMTHLLNNVLILGRAEAGKLQVNLVPLNLAKFCRSLVEEMQLSVGIKHAIALSQKGDCTNTCMDENLLRHILANLLSNAIKYSPPFSTVNFELSCQDGEAIFQINDEGIGIPPIDQPRLFDSFHRGENVGDIPGTGLGLTVVKKYVDLHNGKITFANNGGVGTTFTVTLPCSHPAGRS